MTGDETNDRRRTASVQPTRPRERPEPARSAPVLGAYDAVEGTESFVVAAADRDDAWLAVEAGGELAPREWR